MVDTDTDTDTDADTDTDPDPTGGCEGCKGDESSTLGLALLAPLAFFAVRRRRR